MANKYEKQTNKMQTMEFTYVAFCQGTKLPFVTCDEETYNDQAWIFETEDQAKAFGKKRAEEQKDVLLVVKIENKQLLQFYSSLYTYGVNELVFTEEKEQTILPLTALVREPDYSKLPKERQPLLNPQMTLTGIYFMQELYRQCPNNEKPKLHELEEEMAANLVRSNFLVAIEVDGEERKADGSNVKIPCVKNQEGKMYQPIFTDPNELAKFNVEQKFKASLIEFKNVQKIIGANVEGLVVNPQSLNIIILKDKVQMLMDRFGK